ncbi:hypothetical protein JG687_00013182 [Phytophthora cactorum]|uniref:Uncharacterized protein n=1 Tax=Phytophthora cactorum TaxID=29920 RepID=A0A8T1TZX1_9STRA|nr:hypothetical protein PC120_g20370 [Phytophthora cactorum]KAG3047861.1 hypothetical protein PC121_g19819 [Phytophthora cactorum]KAG4057963.1 hypothetical protein PC123_g7069 [Phytophthora cactorum]KAG6952162.1 hypothetical protein JG687_00013182 [Phytophthora cactorum]
MTEESAAGQVVEPLVSWEYRVATIEKTEEWTPTPTKTAEILLTADCRYGTSEG